MYNSSLDEIRMHHESGDKLAVYAYNPICVLHHR